MSERIRWEEAEHRNIAGYVGTVDGRVFKLQHPVLAGERWVLTTDLPGWLDAVEGGTPDGLKAEAEKWLEEFVSSLGASFPDDEISDDEDAQGSSDLVDRSQPPPGGWQFGPRKPRKEDQ